MEQADISKVRASVHQSAATELRFSWIVDVIRSTFRKV